MLCSVLPGCSAAPIESRANQILDLTVPQDARPPALTGPLWAGQSVSFRWEVETALRSDAYVEWLRTRLRGYAAHQSTASRWTFTRAERGDSYRLELTLEAAAPGTRARYTFAASPD